MSYEAFQENLQAFSKLIEKLPSLEDKRINLLIKQYIDQNLLILNDVLTTSMESLRSLQKAKTPNDVICTQARFTNEISKRLALSTQRFLNASLGHIADYNEWLKAHCDLATD